MSTAQAHHRAQPGEVYVTLADYGVVFPAVIEDERWRGFVRPRFRREVTETVVVWLNESHHAGTTAAFEGDALIVADSAVGRSDRIGSGADRRYPIGAGTWEWELTTPAAEIPGEEVLLAEADQLTRETGEILVRINATGHDPAFPGLPDPVSGWSRSGTPRFRAEVAVVVVAWLSACGRRYPGGTVAYWENDEIVLVDRLAAAQDGYVPTRVLRDADGRYAIGADFEWEHAED
jgi:hypothetical protein